MEFVVIISRQSSVYMLKLGIHVEQLQEQLNADVEDLDQEKKGWWSLSRRTIGMS